METGGGRVYASQQVAARDEQATPGGVFAAWADAADLCRIKQQLAAASGQRTVATALLQLSFLARQHRHRFIACEAHRVGGGGGRRGGGSCIWRAKQGARPVSSAA